MKLAGGYLGEESPIFLLMGTWRRHIDRFDWQFDKAFAKDPLFGADLMDRIHKSVQVFFHSLNTTSIEDVESGALAEFGGLHKKVERGEWLTLTLVWVDCLAPKKDGHRKSDGHGIGSRPSCGWGGRDVVFNNGLYPQLWIMERLGDMTPAEYLENLRYPLGG